MKQFRFAQLGVATLLSVTFVQCVVAQRWSEMDYGPFLTSTLEVSLDNFAYKSIAIRLDDGEGGVSQGNVFVSFDTDTLRYSAGWMGSGFMDWRSVVFDGSHNTHPSLVGDRVFVNPAGPGWGRPEDGSFQDSRLRGVDGRAYGPLDRKWGHWNGLYRHGNRVVLSYTVGSTAVLDMPGLEEHGDSAFITRSLQLGAREKDLVLQVAQLPDCAVQMKQVHLSADRTLQVGVLAPDLSGEKLAVEGQGDSFSFRGNQHFLIANADDLNLATADFTIMAMIRTKKDGTIFSKTELHGPWARNGKTLFVRDGRLCYDIGWVGELRSRKQVNDNQWHSVAATYEAAQGMFRLYVDGRAQGERVLRPELPVRGHVARIGYTASNFPRPQSAFLGDIRSLRFYQRRLTDQELREPGSGDDEQLLASWTPGQERDGKLSDTTGNEHDALLVRGDGATEHFGVAVTSVGLADPQWMIAPEGSLQLRIPRGDEPLRFKLLFAPLGREVEVASLATAAAESARGPDLAEYTRGGAPLWPELLKTETTSLDEAEDGTFEVETLTIPQQNPWRSWMRLGGFDFFADGDRAAVCSWQGDVWLVRGLSDKSGKLLWRRIASGLFQPLGLKIVDDRIYVLGRDQITLLHDLNGDGESDYYENFNNDMQVTEHFHEFAMDLQTDQHGDFYFMKAARHALPAIVPHHGTLIQVTRDGQQARVLARGFRAPDGLLVNDDGTFLTSDQEGHWTPMNRINWIRPGGFYGNMMAANPQNVASDATDPPVCWIHRGIDRSPTAQVWVPRGRWGSLGGSLLSLSYGTGKTFRVLYEHAGDVMQGGLVQLPIPEFPTGIQRGRFHPRDGQLYLCGLFGWSSDKTLAGGFYRVRHTGKEVTTPSALAACNDGVWLQFPLPLDDSSASDPRNFLVSRWNYRRTATYGSDDYRVSDGKRGRDRVRVSQVSVSRDRKSVFLHVDDMTRCMQMRIEYQLQGAESERIAGLVDHTVNVLKEPDADVRDRFDDALQPSGMPSGSAQRIDESAMRPGLALSITSRSNETLRDHSVVRTVALRVGSHELPTLFAQPGPFSADWTGFINSDLPTTVTFQAQVTGAVSVWVNEQEVLRCDMAAAQGVASEQVDLQAGLNSLRVRLASLKDGKAALRLHWKRGNNVSELLRPEVLVHDPRSIAQQASLQQLRSGRELVARSRCARCHDAGDISSGMPEMNLDLPSLAGVGDRLGGAWMRRWISDPQAMRNDITMPHVLYESSSQEIDDIVGYLQSLRTDDPVTGDQVTGDQVTGDQVTGDQVTGDQVTGDQVTGDAKNELEDDNLVESGLYMYEDLGCIACHHLEAPDYEDPYERTTLHYVGAKYRVGALIRFLRQPHEFYAARRMPDFQLSLAEARALAAYLRDVSQAIDPKSLGVADVQRGKQAFTDRGCAACHAVTANDVLPQPGERPMFELSDMSRGCLAQDDSQRDKAPQYSFSSQQRDALIAFLGTDGSSLNREIPSEAAERFVRQLRCSTCHRRDGQMPYLPEILAEEGEQGHPAESLPPLTWGGEKLQNDWLHNLLAGKLDDTARPWKRGRMPAFPAYARVLADGLAAQHGVGTTREENSAPDTGLVRLGKRLTEQDQGFHCLQCHGLPDKPPEAPFESRGIDFHYVEDRLRAEFYQRWIRNPVQFDSAVPMPRFSPDNKTTPVTTVLDGNARRQFDAIWEYLKTVNDQE